MRKWFIFSMLCIVLVVAGCAATKQALDNYDACKGDQACIAQMEQVKSTTYAVVEPVVGSVSSVSLVSSGLALVISNLVAFGFGVLKGKKKG